MIPRKSKRTKRIAFQIHLRFSLFFRGPSYYFYQKQWRLNCSAFVCLFFTKKIIKEEEELTRTISLKYHKGSFCVKFVNRLLNVRHRWEKNKNRTRRRTSHRFILMILIKGMSWKKLSMGPVEQHNHIASEIISLSFEFPF